MIGERIDEHGLGASDIVQHDCVEPRASMEVGGRLRTSLDTVMGELAASLAHEINQPLAAMVTSAEACLLWLERERPDLENARRAAQRIVRDGHHAGNVIRGICTLLGRSSPQTSSTSYATTCYSTESSLFWSCARTFRPSWATGFSCSRSCST
jgi:hypothetical protein